MTSALYLENFLESIENLPHELRRNFALMRDLDQRTEDAKIEIENKSKNYRSRVGKMNKDEKILELNKIQDMFKKAVENSDNKVQIAMQMYEMVDKYIRKLDAELSRFEQDLQLKDVSVGGGRPSISSISDIVQPLNVPRTHRKRPGGAGSDGISTHHGGSKPRRRKMGSFASDDTGPSSIASPSSAVMNNKTSTDVLDMPVDPNEPTYCLCHQVSFGEMIGCDNIDCPIEWFHFQCVGLSAKPKGKWFCPKCSSQERERKKKY